MRYLGIDYGTKRIGVAVSNESGQVAFPLGVVEAGKEALSKIAELIREHSVEQVVIGESRNLKNEPNPLMEDIEQFKKDLAELTGLPVVYQPEFFTSVQATRQAQDKRGAQIENAKVLDASAAALILQGYLDTIRNHGAH